MKKLLISTAIAAGIFAAIPVAPANAGNDPFLGEIEWFAGNFAPRGWAFCDGQLLPINQNQALFSILGTIYGGDGRTTFGLPDMRSRSPMHPGSGPGLSTRTLGQKLGAENNTLIANQLPSHNHNVQAHGSTGAPDTTSPNNGFLASSNIYVNFGSADTTLRAGTVTQDNVGGGQQVNNMQPSLGINCIIALQGTFPSRN